MISASSKLDSFAVSASSYVHPLAFAPDSVMTYVRLLYLSKSGPRAMPNFSSNSLVVMRTIS